MRQLESSETTWEAPVFRMLSTFVRAMAPETMHPPETSEATESLFCSARLWLLTLVLLPILFVRFGQPRDREIS